jgi:hypothetical protein
MTSGPKPDASEVGQPLSGAGEGHRGDGDSHGERSDDATSPESKPQGTLRDQETTMDSEGPAAAPPEPEDLPATTDDEAEREREAKLSKDGSGF